MCQDRTLRCCEIGLLLVALGLGCASARVQNVALERVEPGVGYGEQFRRIAHGDDVRVVLAFSGGGTRAAALAYGVLKEIRDTPVVLDGVDRRLLDQVSAISSVSGGSFTAAYYGLEGDRIFEDYEEKFLRKNFDARLALSLLRPLELLKIVLTPYTRSDMAIDLYDEKIFGGATFSDLAARPGPLLNINATDIDVGGVFSFIQPDFDPICSNLAPMRVATAVTASSAVPGIFAPLMLRNHAGECGFEEPRWMQEAFANPTASRRRYHQARDVASYLDARARPYVFLVDGGVADNIGARRLLASVIDAGSIDAVAKQSDIEVPENLLYIVVNAQASGEHHWNAKGKLPSIVDVMSAISGTGIYRYNFETIELLRESAAQWSRQVAATGGALNAYVAEVAFDNLADPDERKFFNDLKTSFDLDDETVDRLIEVGGRLLRDSPDFQRFLSDLGS